MYQRFLFNLFVFFIFFLASLSFWSIQAKAWTTQNPDVPRYFSSEQVTSRSFALDSSGYPHIVYGEDHLYHASYNGLEWTTETVDDSSSVGRYAAIAIDSSGHVHISYYDDTNDDLKRNQKSGDQGQSLTCDKLSNGKQLQKH